jgi:hypothetical protein
MKKLSLVYILFLSLFSCKDDVDPFGPLILEFDNRIEDHPGYTITYDITGIKLKRQDDGLLYKDYQTYHMDASNEASQEITLEKITSGGYSEVSFVVNSLTVHGPVEFLSGTDTVTLSMPRTPVRAEHRPQVHLIFNVDKVTTSVQDAFVVDHIHEN